MSSASSSARTASADHLAQGFSHCTGCWNSSDGFDGSSTPRPHRHHDSPTNSWPASRSFDSSPPLLLSRSSPPLPLSRSTPDRSSRDPSPTPATSATSLTSGFEKWDTKNGIFYRYKAEYHKEWTEWLRSKSEYKSWLNSHPRDKRGSKYMIEMKWGNSGVRSSTY